ncbi:hypothetical protein FNH13_04245 [Ornithinimicrobium ciconiae]|uniref:DNA modification methylase n=1 Tax=Ornithinimicrobium ciconiae TaxID=2594265 RepID=A0A516G7Z0_9MICO|nr:hypothetical protein [Ornithinimicrobium ciconiae]QDO87646.1 hypothetical protein FNH13_04245 [Ornithinimicrobium ciconiae]
MTTRKTAPQHAPRSRRLAASGLALAAALTLSACQISSPVTTDMGYDPADGVSVDAGDIAVRDLLVVSEGAGAPGVVSGLVVNNAEEPAEVTLSIAVDGQTQTLTPTVSVDPGQAVRLDGGGDSSAQMTIPSVSQSAGGNVEILVQSSLGEADNGIAPVMLPTGYYSDLAPSTADVSE